MPNVTREELRTVAVFHDLPDDQLDWFLEHATEVRFAPGEIYVRAGDPADKMMVVLEGELQARFDRRRRDRVHHPRRQRSRASCRTRG